MPVFRSDYRIGSLSGGATSQQFTNIDPKGKAYIELRIPPLESRLFNPLPDLIISADPIEIVLAQHGEHDITWTPVERNPDLDQTFDCYGLDRYGVPDQGVIGIEAVMLGDWGNITMWADPIEVVVGMHGGTGEQYGASSVFEGIIIVADPMEVVITME